MPETTSYRQFLSEVLAHPIQGPVHADVVVGVTRNITGMANVIRMTGGDPEGIRHFADENKARRFAAKEEIKEWNPLLDHRITTTIVVSELVPLDD